MAKYSIYTRETKDGIFELYDGKKWKMVNIQNNPIPVTYNKLRNLADNKKLEPHAKYLITDFQTIHYIPYSNDEINAGGFEQIIVTAANQTDLFAEAYSTEYGEDILYYELRPENGRPFRRMVPNNNKGFIYYRENTRTRNACGFDYKAVKFRRWKPDFNNLPVEVDYLTESNSINDYLLHNTTVSVGRKNTDPYTRVDIPADPNDYVDLLCFGDQPDDYDNFYENWIPLFDQDPYKPEYELPNIVYLHDPGWGYVFHNNFFARGSKDVTLQGSEVYRHHYFGAVKNCIIKVSNTTTVTTNRERNGENHNGALQHCLITSGTLYSTVFERVRNCIINSGFISDSTFDRVSHTIFDSSTQIRESEFVGLKEYPIDVNNHPTFGNLKNVFYDATRGVYSDGIFHQMQAAGSPSTLDLGTDEYKSFVKLNTTDGNNTLDQISHSSTNIGYRSAPLLVQPISSGNDLTVNHTGGTNKDAIQLPTDLQSSGITIKANDKDWVEFHFINGQPVLWNYQTY